MKNKTKQIRISIMRYVAVGLLLEIIVVLGITIAYIDGLNGHYYPMI